MTKCKCKTIDGHRCRRSADPNSEIDYCWQHQQDEGWIHRCNSLRRSNISPRNPPKTSKIARSLMKKHSSFTDDSEDEVAPYTHFSAPSRHSSASSRHYSADKFYSAPAGYTATGGRKKKRSSHKKKKRTSKKHKRSKH
jgi:hypothetical protein